MCPARVRPERPERLVHLDAACASGHRFFSLMHDVVVSAQTGSRKSMCYLGLPFASPDTCVLVICPLLALMSDQVRSAEELEVRAVHLCAETIMADGEIIKAVRCGEFSMVFMTAEFTSMANGAWKSLVSEDKQGKLPNFSSKLQYIVIEKVHLVHEWFVISQGSFTSYLLTLIDRRIFRPRYCNLGLLQARFSDIPILSVSATLPANTLEYIHQSLSLN